MKFLNCTSCGDIVLLKDPARYFMEGKHRILTTCDCTRSYALYDSDGITIHVYGKHARIIGLGNNEYYKSFDEKRKNEFVWNVLRDDGEYLFFHDEFILPEAMVLIKRKSIEDFEKCGMNY